MKGGRWRWIAVVLAIALAASIALGLLGLWPDLRGESTSDRRERVQIAEPSTETSSTAAFTCHG
jgi:hypothetical protein